MIDLECSSTHSSNARSLYCVIEKGGLVGSVSQRSPHRAAWSRRYQEKGHGLCTERDAPSAIVEVQDSGVIPSNSPIVCENTIHAIFSFYKRKYSWSFRTLRGKRPDISPAHRPCAGAQIQRHQRTDRASHPCPASAGRAAAGAGTGAEPAARPRAQ
jgi:hypothetical protein